MGRSRTRDSVSTFQGRARRRNYLHSLGNADRGPILGGCGFFYKWLTARQLKITDLGRVKAVPAVDPALQLALAEGTSVSRQKVINNLPGTINFCPFVRRTARVEEYQQAKLDQRAREISGRTHPDILARAAAFLLLSDSLSITQ
jgi:hypothetical protein